MASTLIVFVDGLPHYYLVKARFLSSFPHQKKISPGVGFSVNIKPELFAGLTPDDVGYFCEWSVSDTTPPLWKERLAILHFAYRWPILERILHKTFNRLGFDLLNIPFGYVRYFEKGDNKSVYESDFAFPTLFSQTDIVPILADTMNRVNGPRDVQAYQAALEKVKEAQGVYVSFMGMDEAAHRYGVGSSEYDRTLARLDGWIEDLVNQFEARNPDGNTVVFSDHGMANVVKGVRVNFERHLGPSNPHTYLYFVDSVMIRMWIYEPSLYAKASDLLNGLGYGTILTLEKRVELGCTASYCGDIIFVLHEGYVFAPSFFGLKRVAAMHGYLPDSESQQAVFLARGGNINAALFDQVQQTRDVYPFLLKLF
jgi:hypothetical protein